MSVITTYTAYVLGQFKAKYPHVHNMADAGFILFGPVGREIFGLGSALFLSMAFLQMFLPKHQLMTF